MHIIMHKLSGTATWYPPSFPNVAYNVLSCRVGSSLNCINWIWVCVWACTGLRGVFVIIVYSLREFDREPCSSGWGNCESHTHKGRVCEVETLRCVLMFLEAPLFCVVCVRGLEFTWLHVWLLGMQWGRGWSLTPHRLVFFGSDEWRMERCERS